MEKNSSNSKLSTSQQKEDIILQEMQHTPSGVNTIIKEEIKSASSALNKVIEEEFILSDLDSAASKQECTIIKSELIVTEPEHEGLRDKEGLRDEIYSRQSYINGQVPSVQEESPVVTFNSCVIKGEEAISDGSPNTVTKEEFIIDESTTQSTTAQKCKLENRPKCELANVSSTIPESSDSPLSNVPVVIKEELISEGTNEEHLIVKCYISDIHSDIYEDEVYQQQRSESLSQPKKLKVKHPNQNYNKYRCEVCGKIFAHGCNLSQHKRIHSGIKKYECDLCHKTFTYLSTLYQHKQVHSGTKKYECDLCHKTFTRASTLAEHKDIHSGVKKYECDVCHKTFTQSSGLSQHKRIHSGMKNHECDVCHKTFNKSSNLLQHRQIHGRIKYYECDVCHKTFTRSTSLSEHKQIHNGIKRFECEVCHKTFIKSSNLSQHQQIHNKVKMYECDVCHKSFTFSSGLSRHNQIHSPIKK